MIRKCQICKTRYKIEAVWKTKWDCDRAFDEHDAEVGNFFCGVFYLIAILFILAWIWTDEKYSDSRLYLTAFLSCMGAVVVFILAVECEQAFRFEELVDIVINPNFEGSEGEKEVRKSGGG